MPAYAAEDPVASVYRTPWCDLAALQTRVKDVGSYGLIVYCDVLRIDGALTVDAPLFAMARRIELCPNAALTLNRLEDDFGITLVTGQIVAAGTGSPASLSLSELVLDEAGIPSVVETAISLPQPHKDAGSDRKKVDPRQIIVPSRAEAGGTPNAVLNMRQSHFDEPGSGLLIGDPLRQMLTTQFQIAAVVAASHPDVATLLLKWVAAVARASPDGFDLRTEAELMQARVARMAAADGTAPAVPDFDHEVFSTSAIAAVNFATQRQRDWNALQDKINDIDTRIAALQLQAEDRDDEKTLLDELVGQSRTTLRGVQVARSNTIKDLSLATLATRRERNVFLAKIDTWKSKQIEKEIKNLLRGLAEIALNIPVLVPAGPQIKGLLQMGSEIDLARLASQAALAGPELLRNAGVVPAGNVAAPAQVMELDDNDAMESVHSDPDAIPLRPIPHRQDDNSASETRSTTSFDSAQTAFSSANSVSGGSNTNSVFDLDDDDDYDSFDEEGEIEIRRLGLQGDMVKADKRKAYEEERARKHAMQSARLEKSALAANAVLNAGKRMYERAGNLASAAKSLAHISETASQIERASQNMLDAAQRGYVSSTKLEMTGIDVVTGGAHFWDNVLLEIGNMFDRIGDGLLGQIDGDRALQLALHKVVVHGRSVAEAKVAVASATLDFAQLIFRQNAAEAKARNFSAAVDRVADRKAQVDILGQIAFWNVIEAKLTASLSLEAYRRALAYYTLADDAALPRLPGLADGVAVYERAARDIAGQLLTVQALPAPPQSLTSAILHLPPAEVANLRNGGVPSWTLPIDHPTFQGLSRLRINTVRVYLEGLVGDRPIDISLTCGPRYQDRSRDGQIRAFHGPNIHRPFRYVPATGRIVVDGHVTARHRNDYFEPTPFATWKIICRTNDDSMLDLSALTGVRLEFDGSANDQT